MTPGYWKDSSLLDIQGGAVSLLREMSPLLVAVIVVGLLAYRQKNNHSKHSGEIQDLGGIPLLNVWPFFKKRYDFIWDNFHKIGGKSFRFRVLQHRVITLFGEAGRKAFFNDATLNLPEGYRILMGGIPRLEDIKVSTTAGTDTTYFGKAVLHLLRRERVNDMLPTLFDDVQRRMQDWGDKGQINPFKEVYDLVFQMTVRLATCRELSEDKEAIERLAAHYWDLERSATPTALLLPWFPGKAKKLQQESITKLYALLRNYVEGRRKVSELTSDAIDALISRGDTDDDIIGFILNVIFAGVVNTGMNVCWNLLYIGMNPEWKEKVTAEINTIISKYTDPSSPEPLKKRLSSVPVEAWEEELPILDSALRETLRIITTNAVLRRNLDKDIEIDGTKVGRGDFLVYSLADVHLNPDIYTEPMKWDPARFGPGREEDKKTRHGFAAWGLGRHPCLGMRVAKLEIKLVLALIIAGYDWEIVNSEGNRPKKLPQPDKNDIQQARPIGDPCYLKFCRINR